MAKYKSEIKKVLHQEAVSMHRIGGISDDRMREYDEMCLVKPAALVTRNSPQPSAAARPSAPVYARGK